MKAANTSRKKHVVISLLFGGGIMSNLFTDEQLKQCHLQIKFVLCVDHTRTKTVSDFEGARASA